MSRSGQEPADSPESLVARVGVPLDDELLDLALTHRSWAYENGGAPTNERLEFLGDSVLGIIVTDHLYHRFPDLPEGQLAKLRAAIVNARALAAVARELELGRYLKLGRGEQTSGGRDKSSILADAVEALIGAYYLDIGGTAARTLVLQLFARTIDDAATLGAGLDWKTSLQELAAERALGIPEYVVEESGPDHAKSFRAVTMLGDNPIGEGVGRTKKEAEQYAAERAWTRLSHDAAAVADSPAAEPADPEPADADATGAVH